MAATGTPTPNIGLRIPLGTDPASVDDINYNSTLIDTKLGAVGNDSVQDQIDSVQDQIDELNSNLGSPSSASSVTGADAFSKINSLNSSKIETSAIKNNLTTTSSGYVLDARQGKALNDKIKTSIGYHTLMYNALTGSYEQRSLMNSRKFSSYGVLVFEFYRDTWLIGSAIIMADQFVSSAGLAVVCKWNDTKIEFDAKYVSDTQITVKRITSDSTTMYMRVRGLVLE